MAVAEPYVAQDLVPVGARFGQGLRQYFQGTPVAGWVAFAALAATFFIAIFAGTGGT